MHLPVDSLKCITERHDYKLNKNVIKDDSRRFLLLKEWCCLFVLFRVAVICW